MFERIKIAESICEGVPGQTPTMLVTEGKIEENLHCHGLAPRRVRALSRAEKVYIYPNRKIKNCLIHGPGNYLEECKVLGDFRTKYANSRHTKDRGNSPVPRKKTNRQQKKTPPLTMQWMKLY